MSTDERNDHLKGYEEVADKKKRGRPPLDKVAMTFTLDSDLAEAIMQLEAGQRSAIVNKKLRDAFFTERTTSMTRLPARHNIPFEVIPENEAQFIEQCANEDESAAEALKRLYANQEWTQEDEEAREAFQRSQGIIK